MMDNTNLVEHFSQWYDFFDSYTYSGAQVADRVNELVPDASLVLDIGCGYNRLKGAIPNLIGCDIVNPEADLILDMSELPFSDNSVDCIIALGSVNFYSYKYVSNQIKFLYSLLRPGGYMLFRGNPGEYGVVKEEDITLFKWTEEAIHKIAEDLCLKVITVKKDYIDISQVPEKYHQYKKESSFRYYWEYQKNG